MDQNLSELNSEDLVEGSLVWAKIKVGLLDFGVFNFPTFVCSRVILCGPVWSPEIPDEEFVKVPDSQFKTHIN